MEADPARQSSCGHGRRSPPRRTTRSGPTRARRSRVIAQRQADALRTRLPQVSIHYAMRYGHPGIAAAIEQMAAKAAPASSPHRSIRNIAQRRPRRRTMRCSAYWRGCGGSRRSERFRLTMTIRSTSRRCAANLSRQLAALDFEPERLLLSFHGMPAADARARRSLSLPLSEDCAAAGRSARPRGGRRVPVEVRPREVARAGDGRDACRLSEAGRQARRGRRARFFRRLHRNAGGAWNPRPRHVSSTPAASEFALLDCLNEFARKHRDAGTG